MKQKTATPDFILPKNKRFSIYLSNQVMDDFFSVKQFLLSLQTDVDRFGPETGAVILFSCCVDDSEIVPLAAAISTV